MFTMLASPDATFRAWMEILYFTSGVVLASVAGVGLYQIFLTKKQLQVATDLLRTAKDDIQVRSQREAVALAAQLVEKFAVAIHANGARIRTIEEARIVPVRPWPLENATFDRSSIKDISKADDWLRTLRTNVPATNEMIHILNELEGFAVYFARGAADEETAFPSAGPMLCQWAETFAPYLIAVREGSAGVTSGPFQNLIALYCVWAARLKKQQLERQSDRIKSELSGITVPEIKPIGTDLTR